MCLIYLALFAGFLVPAAVAQQVDDGFKIESTDWPWWRGPGRQGEAARGQNLPLTWNQTQNVVWKTKVPGRGHGSPIVCDAFVFLTSADESSGAQYVIAYDRRTGEQRWQTAVHEKGGMRKNSKSSAASSSVACDGQRVYVTFANTDAVYASALDLKGKVLWQTKVTQYQIHQGYAASPALYQSLVIVSADCKGQGAIAGLNRTDGKIVWTHKRPDNPNYPSPIILNVHGRDQLFMFGCDLVTSLDPLTGKTNWEIEGSTTECVTSTVTDGKSIFTSGGYPRNHLAAVMADGSGKVVWDHETRVYVPSLVIRDGYLYGVLDAGVAACWDASTGEEQWKARLGGTFSSSPVLVDDKIYVINEEGQAFIFKADPKKYESLGKNQLGTEVFATPTIVANRIYVRVTEQLDGQRQEVLYCLGLKE